ncbi:suppressor of gene silencing like protein [Tanacetum coccineum]
MGTTVAKFANDPSGLKDAMRLADFFEKQKHGHTSWASIQSSLRPGKDNEKDPNFVKLDKRTTEKERILYGYLGTVFDLEGGILILGKR